MPTPPDKPDQTQIPVYVSTDDAEYENRLKAHAEARQNRPIRERDAAILLAWNTTTDSLKAIGKVYGLTAVGTMLVLDRLSACGHAVMPTQDRMAKRKERREELRHKAWQDSPIVRRKNYDDPVKTYTPRAERNIVSDTEKKKYRALLDWIQDNITWDKEGGRFIGIRSGKPVYSIVKADPIFGGPPVRHYSINPEEGVYEWVHEVRLYVAMKLNSYIYLLPNGDPVDALEYYKKKRMLGMNRPI
jgi:hypothetical protein